MLLGSRRVMHVCGDVIVCFRTHLQRSAESYRFERVCGRAMYCNIIAQNLRKLREFRFLNNGQCYWDPFMLRIFVVMSLSVFESFCTKY